MRLYELINFEPKKSRNNIQTMNKRLQQHTKPEPMGSGSFGTAYQMQSNKRLNQVTKVGQAAELDSYIRPTDDIKKDGYLSWIKAVQESGSNPYYPVVHDLKVKRSPNGTIHYSINLEKLVNFLSSKIIGNKDLMIAICEKMFGPAHYDGVDFETFVPNSLQRSVTDGSKVSDKQLEQAIELVRNVKNDGKFMADVSGNNIMWRITGNMPQLVIVDPLA